MKPFSSRTTALKVLAGIMLFLAPLFEAPNATAQFGSTRQRTRLNATQRANRTANSVNTGGVLSLPEGVSNVISIDAHNLLLAQFAEPDNKTPSQIVPFVVRHVYSGGIAKLFGGVTVSSEIFVSPAFNDDAR